MTEALFSLRPVTWRALTKTIATSLSIITAVGCVAWTISSQVSDIHERADRLEQRVAELAATLDARTLKGETERARVDAASERRHEAQQVEIDRLRLAAETTGASIAVLNIQLNAIIEAIREVRNDVRAGMSRPMIEPPQPQSRLDRIPPQPWGGVPLQSRGAPR